MASDYALSGDHGGQLPLLDDMPTPGDRYTNEATGYVATVVYCEQRRHLWVVVRHGGIERELSFADFVTHYRPL